MKTAKNQNHNLSFLPGVETPSYRSHPTVWPLAKNVPRTFSWRSFLDGTFLGGSIQFSRIIIVERRGGCRSSEGAQALCGGSFAAAWTFGYFGSSQKNKKEKRSLIIQIYLSFKIPCFWRQIYSQLSWKRPKTKIIGHLFNPGVKTPGYQSDVPMGHFSENR